MESRLDGRTFVKFHIDVGIGDVILEPVETITTRDWLAFAEIPSPSVMMTTREQQFAEKIHAYTLPRSSPNSRVRDLVDLYLLIASGSLNLVLCAEALRRTFERRRTAGPTAFRKSWFHHSGLGSAVSCSYLPKSAASTSAIAQRLTHCSVFGIH